MYYIVLLQAHCVSSLFRFSGVSYNVSLDNDDIDQLPVITYSISVFALDTSFGNYFELLNAVGYILGRSPGQRMSANNRRFN